MKKVLFSLMALAIALTACKKEEQIVPEIKADKTEINVPVTGTEDAEEDVFIVFTANVDWTASVQDAEWLTITPAKGTPEKGKIKLIAEASTEKDPRTAVVVVTAGTAKKEFKVIQGQVDAFSLVEETASIDSKGGEVSLKVMTNIPYKVTIPSEATWVKEVATKAYGEQVTKLSVEAFDELDGVRTADIKISATGFEDLTFKLTQNGPQTKIWGIDLRSVIERSTAVTIGTVTDYKANVSIAVLGDKLVVCQGDGKTPLALLDKKTGEKKGTLNTGEIAVYSITNDDAGHLILSNRNAYDKAASWWTGAFEAYYMTSETATPVKFVSGAKYGPAGSVIIARGDVTKDGLFVTPYEGIPGISCANGIGYWTIKEGVVSEAATLNLTGFVGLAWQKGFWNMAPSNIPAMGFLSTDFSAGGLMGVYDENKLYTFDKDGACTLISEDPVADSNHGLNAMDIRTIKGKPYGAALAAPFYPQWSGIAVIAVANLSDGSVVFNASTAQYPKEEETLNGIDIASDIILEPSDDGFNLYYIDINSSAIEAFHCPLK